MDVGVLAEGEGTRSRAEELADRLGLPLLDGAGGEGLALTVTGSRLELRELGSGAAGPVFVQFRPSRGRPTILRAAQAGRTPPPRVIDCTAGLGGDSFDLAWAGCTVELVERNPLVAVLLEDGLRRAQSDPLVAGAAERMRLHQGDARRLLELLAPPDVVYLDPMYPVTGAEGRKGKKMRLLRVLLGGDEDADGLLAAARAAALARVVVKRPRRAPPLAGARPSGSLEGRTVRFDIYPPAPHG